MSRTDPTNRTRTFARRALSVALASLLAATALAGASGCGGGDPKSAATTADFRALTRAPGTLGELYREGARIVDGGPSAFRRRVGGLRGHPVIVNKWASWCAPCRREFPFFQQQARKQGSQIAFLGVDGEDSKSAARHFLKRFPVPYPSFFDTHGEIAAVFRGDRVFPTTAYYDREGQLVYTKQGGYATEEALARDIARWAR